MQTTAPTVADLLAYARELATISSRDYFEPGYARPEEVSAWHSDRGTRDRQRAKVFRDYGWRMWRQSTPLVPGNYYGTRLSVTESGIDYTAGQYPALEIWAAVYDYFRQSL